MPKKQHQVELSEEDKSYLEEMIAKGKGSAREIRRAHTLLLAHEKRQDQEIAEFFHLNPATISFTRRRYCEVGLPGALKEKPRPGNPRKLDSEQESYLVALACHEAPEGRTQWTMQLLADKLLELQVIDEPISDETVRRTLQKTKLNRG